MTRQPCKTCPWRLDQDATDIPDFRLELAENLVETCPDENGYGPDYGAPMFACHQSTDTVEIVCAGWLATNGIRHPAARIGVVQGKWPKEALRPGPDWPELHAEYSEVLEKLRRTAP